MIKKTIIIAVTILFILPTLCLSGDVEVQDVQLKWIEKPPGFYMLRAKVSVVNPTDRDRSVFVHLRSYDKAGFVIKTIPFSGSIKAGESKILFSRGLFSADQHKEITTYLAEAERLF